MTFGIISPKMNRLITPLFGGGMPRTENSPRRYRSIKRYVRANYKSSANFAADVSGQPRPPVRQRRKFKAWRL